MALGMNVVKRWELTGSFLRILLVGHSILEAQPVTSKLVECGNPRHIQLTNCSASNDGNIKYDDDILHIIKQCSWKPSCRVSKIQGPGNKICYDCIGEGQTNKISCNQPDKKGTTESKTEESPFTSEDTGQASKSAVVAVAVTISILLVAGSLIAFILLFRRLDVADGNSRKLDAVYKNTPTAVEQRQDDGFTNVTYFKETNSLKQEAAHTRSVDTSSNSGDSGYTDMHNEDYNESENNDYCVIKENKILDSVDEADDQYYAIKENPVSEYNKIAFKPKDIPEDPNYGHIHKARLADATYDHTEGALKHTKKQADGTDYSHITQSKLNTNSKGCNNAWEQNKNPGTENNVEDFDAQVGHDYFILEQSEIKSSAENEEKVESDTNDTKAPKPQKDDESHSYYLLLKEDASNVLEIKDSNQPCTSAHDPIQIAHEANSLKNIHGLTYFEDPNTSSEDRDSHPYQEMGQRVTTNELNSPENIDHDYFILQSENI